MDTDPKLQKVFDSMAQAKQQLAEHVSKATSIPVRHAASVAIQYLDTAYLWMTQIHMLMQMETPEAVEAAAEQALAAGNVVPFPGTKAE